MGEVNITPEQKTEDQAYIDAMVAKAEGRTPGAPAAAGEPAPAAAQEQTERPSWLPEKFATPEDMAKAYAAMEQKLSGKPAEAPADAPEGSQQEAAETAEKAVEAAGLDMNALGDKIGANGDLDEADYEALAKVGISKEMVKTYVDGQKAIGERLVSNMHAAVGGEERFNDILEWARDSLSQAERDAFNSTVDNGNEAAIKLALEGLNAKYTAAGNKKPQLLQGGKPEATNDVFRSTAELTAAMRDPRYGKDPAYRDMVAQKLARSSII